MMKKVLACLLVIVLLIISGCNISDFKYLSKDKEVEQVCDEETKICYPVEEKAADGEEFNEEFEKLKKIVEEMNEKEGTTEEKETKEEVTEKEETTEEVVETKKEATEEKIEEKTEVVEEVKEEITKEVETTEEASDSTKFMSVDEGELVKLNVKTNDPDGDVIKFIFSDPLDKDGEWQTELGDAGKYTIYVTASDGQSKQTTRIVLNVIKLNRAPVLDQIDDIVVNEGETVIINPTATDEDKDELTFSYSGWMSSSSYRTDFDDAGEYTVQVTVTDDDDESASQDVKITVNDKNRPPTIVDITLG